MCLCQEYILGSYVWYHTLSMGMFFVQWQYLAYTLQLNCMPLNNNTSTIHDRTHYTQLVFLHPKERNVIIELM